MLVFFAALLEEGRKVIAERFGEDEAEGNGSSAGEEVISLTPIEASPTLPGRAAWRV